MAVAPASLAEGIIILDDDDDEDSPQPSRPAAFTSPKARSPPAPAPAPAPTHITESPFASAKKEGHVLQVENQRLFDEFVAYCAPLTLDCPEVLTFLHTKHLKASPPFLASVEFRNALGRCLTRAQANRSKTFVYINEMCTLLRQHASKRRQSLLAAAPATLAKRKEGARAEGAAAAAERNGPEEELPSTSRLQEEEAQGGAEEARSAGKASRRQIAYLENLLKVYNEEIRRLQEKEMSLDDLEAEDSGYIQEDKLKHKMMKIYNKLCELKSCTNLTGRVIEQRLGYSSTRYPEINKKIERFINSPEARRNPPDYPDIRQLVQRANQRHSLGLSPKQVNQMAQEAFRETGSRMQERRQLDLVYNFGSHLTDRYSAARDPAITDPALLRKLRSNREVALTNLEEVISKFSVRQEDTEEQERSNRLDKERQGKEGEKTGEERKGVNGKLEEEEEEEEEEDYSEPDIEEELLASKLHAGPDDDEEEEEEAEKDQGNKAAGANAIANGNGPAMASEDEGDAAAMRVDAEATEHVADGLGPLSDSDVTDVSPLSQPPPQPSPAESPSQSLPQEPPGRAPSNSNTAQVRRAAAVLSDSASVVHVSAGRPSRDTADLSPAAANGASLPPSPVAVQTNQDSSTATCDLLSANGKSSPLSLRATRGRKRKREEEETRRSHVHTIIPDSEMDLTMDMGLVLTTPPRHSESTRPDTPTHDLVSSSQSTPPPKKNKVNVATQCDPDEIIVLSDSE